MKIAIIKLGALGDVVRTLSILPAIKEKFPESNIFWITKTNALDLIKNNRKIDKTFDSKDEINENFDLLYNFDIDKEATDLAKKLNASKKLGFTEEEGFPSAFNLGAEYYLNTFFDDELKKSNKKTYQQMMFEAAELTFKGEHEPIILNEEFNDYAQDFLKQNDLQNAKIIGIHMGASDRWPSKKWHKERIREFIGSVINKGYKIILFGGPNEIKSHKELFENLKKDFPSKISKNDSQNTTMQFAALVDICSTMVCSDSFALHIALALKKPTICLFFVTSPDEVEGYGLLKKAIYPMLKDFFPEKSDQYSEQLIQSISAEEIIGHLEEIENNKQ